jgi:protocatechuate 3,4-dioxygenase alpha subunit
MSLRATASQTAGPFFSIGLEAGYVADLAGADATGERVTVTGRLLDGAGAPVADGCIEIWQANAHGEYGNDPVFRGFGRVATDATGRFRFTTVKPGRVGGQAPHLVVSVLARGVLNRLATRMYFPDPPDDPVLAVVPPARRRTLIARPAADGALEWDIILQGADETVFFEV